MISRGWCTVIRASHTRDELTGTMTVTSVKQLGGNSMVTSSTEISDASGAHVVTAVSTLVVRAAAEGAQ